MRYGDVSPRVIKRGARRVTSADFEAIDCLLDEVWSDGARLPRWASARMRSIVKTGLPPADRSER